MGGLASMFSFQDCTNPEESGHGSSHAQGEKPSKLPHMISEVPLVYDDGGGRIEVCLRPPTTQFDSQILCVWTDIPGIVLFEWQLRSADEGPWLPPPQPWPPQSGVNGQSLQTMLMPCANGGQELKVLVQLCFLACRWQLFCVGSE